MSEAASTSNIVLFESSDGEVRLDVAVDVGKDEIWLNRSQMSLLFDRDVKTIGKYIANALKEGADELGIDITANAGAYGSHYAIMDQYNVIVLAPQVRTYYNEMKADTDRLGITLLSPKGKQYIDLTKDPKGAVAWIEENLKA